MKNVILIMAALVSSPFCAQAQGANDLVKLWLSQNGIAAMDYQTCDPAKLFTIVGTDGLCFWGADLGPQPTPAQIQALIPAWQTQQATKAAVTAAASAYATATAAGLGISCAPAATVCTPDLAGTYAIDSTAQIDIAANRLSIVADGVQSNGQASMPWSDKSGAFHTMSTPQFNEFATAAKQYVAAWKLYLASIQNGTTTSPPSATVQLQ